MVIQIPVTMTVDFTVYFFVFFSTFFDSIMLQFQKIINEIVSFERFSSE